MDRELLKQKIHEHDKVLEELWNLERKQEQIINFGNNLGCSILVLLIFIGIVSFNKLFQNIELHFIVFPVFIFVFSFSLKKIHDKYRGFLISESNQKKLKELQPKIEDLKKGKEPLYELILKEIPLLIDKLDEIKNEKLYRKALKDSNLHLFREYGDIISMLQTLKNKSNHAFLKNKNLSYRLPEHVLYYKSRVNQKYNYSSSFKRKSKTAQVNRIVKEIPKEQKAIISLDKFLDKMIATQKSDFDSVLAKNTIGALGEEFYLNVEREKLKQLNVETDKYPVHVSKVHGDRFGFDILSLNGDLKPLLIEIKTTTKKKSSSFYLTKNELDKMKKYQDHYQIIRVYDFDKEEKSGEYYSLNYSDLYSKFNMETQVYRVSKIDDSTPSLFS